MLDNPVWYALGSTHRAFRHGTALAARYPADVTRFAGLAAPTPEAFADLATMVQPGDRVALVTAAPVAVPDAWQLMRSRPVDQMVCHRLAGEVAALPARLGTDDVPEMLALTAATDPGPFGERTIGMGRYYGIRAGEDGRLVAMAGERMQLTGYTEVSAVCCDPDFRGRGYARRLVAGLVGQLLAEGRTPFLHVKTENGAKALYEALGFTVRRAVQLTVIALN